MNLNLNNNKARIEVINDHAKIILRTLEGITCENIQCDKCPCNNNGLYLKNDWKIVVEGIIKNTEL